MNPSDINEGVRVMGRHEMGLYDEIMHPVMTMSKTVQNQMGGCNANKVLLLPTGFHYKRSKITNW